MPNDRKIIESIPGTQLLKDAADFIAYHQRVRVDSMEENRILIATLRNWNG